MPEMPKILEFRLLAEGEEANTPVKVDTGLPTDYRDLLQQLKDKQGSRLYLAWEGTKIPRGVELPGGTIAWTQNGIVAGTDGKQLGYYDRVEEWGGPNKNRHKMIISF